MADIDEALAFYRRHVTASAFEQLCANINRRSPLLRMQREMLSAMKKDFEADMVMALARD